MAEYYVVRDKNTGLYFRGKGVNRWGKYYNQASIYRIKANAENTIKEVSWRGEQAEIVPIQIVETTEDVVPKSEVVAMMQWVELLKTQLADAKQEVVREIFEEIENNSFEYGVNFLVSKKTLADIKRNTRKARTSNEQIRKNNQYEHRRYG